MEEQADLKLLYGRGIQTKNEVRVYLPMAIVKHLAHSTYICYRFTTYLMTRSNLTYDPIFNLKPLR